MQDRRHATRPDPLAQSGGDLRPRTALDHPVLDGDHERCLRRDVEQRRVEWTHAADVVDRRLDAVGREAIGRSERWGDAVTDREDAHVRAVAQRATNEPAAGVSASGPSAERATTAPLGKRMSTGPSRSTATSSSATRSSSHDGASTVRPGTRSPSAMSSTP